MFVFIYNEVSVESLYFKCVTVRLDAVVHT